MATLPQPNTFATPLVGVTSVLAIPANPSRVSLFVYNPNVAAVLSICADDTVATVNGAGTITLLPQQGIVLDAWTPGINAISTIASSAITIQEYS